jgi:hypothetical protein
MPAKSCVNGGLQRHQNVLLLGPFKKVSQRLTEPVLFQSHAVNFQGPTSGKKAIGKQNCDEKLKSFAPPWFSRQNWTNEPYRQ